MLEMFKFLWRISFSLVVPFSEDNSNLPVN